MANILLRKVSGDTMYSIIRTTPVYQDNFPYNPSVNYPEYDGELSEFNYAYDAVRESFISLGYDADNIGTPQWNPLKFLINPGDTVFIKPNLVASQWRESCEYHGDLYSIITHPSVIRAVADYVTIALKGRGNMIIGDNPSIDADFNQLCEKTQLHRFSELYDNCEVLDLRPHICDDLKNYGFKSKMKEQNGDPMGSTVVNLGKKSMFYGMNNKRFRGIYSKNKETKQHHTNDTHEYDISNSIYNADVYISIPKLKTHRKVGTTLNLKGLVGINANKNYLVHWKSGYPSQGGDEFPEPVHKKSLFKRRIQLFLNKYLPEGFYHWIYKKTKSNIFQTEVSPEGQKHRGAWCGNDSCWRMVIDLYEVFLRGRRTFSVVDGIIGGDGNGPFCPNTRKSGVIVSGPDLPTVDCICTRLMGFDISEVKYLSYLNIDCSNVKIVSNAYNTEDFFGSKDEYLSYNPPLHWDNLIKKGRESI